MILNVPKVFNTNFDETQYLNDNIEADQRTFHPLKIENFNEELDKYFISQLLVPYLSSVYFGLIAR